jgi:hypothetical protein
MGLIGTLLVSLIGGCAGGFVALHLSDQANRDHLRGWLHTAPAWWIDEPELQ